MSVRLIDDQGQSWSANSRQIREAFDSPYSGGEFVDYALSNLGFAAINDYGTSYQVRLRPSMIGEACFHAVIDWLRMVKTDRIILCWLDTEWAFELIRTPAAAAGRLEQLVSLSRHAKPNDFLSRDVKQHELHPTSPLGHLVRNWSTYSAPASQKALLDLMRATLGQRYVIVKKNDGDGRMTFHEFGSDIYNKYETWRSCAIGAPIEEQPDRNYGRWVAGKYDEAFAVNAPVITDVDAIVRWPHAGRARMRYRRVVVPLHTSSGPPLMLGGPVFDNRIDLRLAAT
jgi:hypothetical protein